MYPAATRSDIPETSMAKNDHIDVDAPESHDPQAHDDLQDCIEECLNCHAVCTLTLQHCIASGGGELTDVHLIGILLDCAEIAQTSANFMLRGSPYHVITCGACAELCRACEEACRGVRDDEQLSHCGDVCASCAESCDRMSQMGSDE